MANWNMRRIARALLLALACVAAQAGAAPPEPIVVAMAYASGGRIDMRGFGVISGAKAYFGRVNAAGGIFGRPVSIESFDDQYDPRQHAAGVRRLVQEKGAMAVLGCVGDAVCDASAAAAAELRIPLVAPLSGSAELARSRNPYVFRVRADHRHEIEAVAGQLAQLGCTRVAVLTDVAGSTSASSAAVASLAARGLKMTVIRVNARTPAGREEVLHALGTGHYQAALLDLDPRGIEDFIDAGLTDREEWPSVLMTTANGDLTSLIASFRGRVMGFTQVVPNAELQVNALARELNQDAERYAGAQAVTPQGMEGYIGARLLVEALRRAGPKPTPARLVEALNAIDNLSLDGFRLAFSNGRETGSDWVEIGLRSRSGVLVN